MRKSLILAEDLTDEGFRSDGAEIRGIGLAAHPDCGLLCEYARFNYRKNLRGSQRKAPMRAESSGTSCLLTSDTSDARAN